MATLSHPGMVLSSRSKMSFEREMQQNIETVTISKVEHEYLILIYGVQAPPKSFASQKSNENPVSKQQAGAIVGNGKSLTAQKYLVDTDKEDTTEDYEDEDEACEEDAALTPAEEKGDNESFLKGRQGSVAPSVQRTVLIRNIPERTTNEDVIAAVRGGALLHIYLRPREHVANVSFVDGSAARAFLQHTKVYGLHVAGKPVNTSWCDRQFYLPPYVAAKINGGASRILVVHNVHPSITEDQIRKDLDHIHNLIVISVAFKHGHVYIATNSIHNALFARSCMMSRRTYKGLKIDFDADECAGSLVPSTTTTPKTMPKKPNHPSPNKPSSRPNRFQILSLGASEGEAEDEAEDDDEDEDDDDEEAEVEDETDDYESISNELNGFSSRNGDVEADDSYWALAP